MPQWPWADAPRFWKWISSLPASSRYGYARTLLCLGNPAAGMGRSQLGRSSSLRRRDPTGTLVPTARPVPSGSGAIAIGFDSKARHPDSAESLEPHARMGPPRWHRPSPGEPHPVRRNGKWQDHTPLCLDHPLSARRSNPRTRGHCRTGARSPPLLFSDGEAGERGRTRRGYSANALEADAAHASGPHHSRRVSRR